MTKWLWAFVFSLSSSSLPAGQASRHQFWPRRGDFEGFGAPKSQTLIVLSADPDTILVPSGENATDMIKLLWALVFSLSISSLPARQASKRQFWPRRGDSEGFGAPESQTLIVMSSDPDTILVPSGENATDLMMSLWAFLFSLSISSLSARQANRCQFWPRRGDLRALHTPESQTLIVSLVDPDTILVPSGENATDQIMLLCAFVFSLNSSSAPAGQANRCQFWPRRGDLRARGAPKSQTLIVPPSHADTIFVPSGENATDMIK